MFDPEKFQTLASDDVVKTDLELTCIECNTVICDVEHGDTLLTLVNMAQDHVCDYEEEDTYMIVRFFQDPDQGRRVIKTGLTLDEAQEHCNDPSTRGEGWFDGYEKED